MNPRTFQLAIDRAGKACPGVGVVAAYVPAADSWPPLLLLAEDPVHGTARPLEAVVPPAVEFVLAEIAGPPGLVVAVIDAAGRFFRVVRSASATNCKPFPGGTGADAFLAATGPAGEVALELLSAIELAPAASEETPTVRQFLEAVEVHGNLPVPGTVFHMIDEAIRGGDIRRVAAIVRTEPVLSLSLITAANSVSFVGGRKTTAMLYVVQRLGLKFVRRIVFVAEMMMRYQKGRCPDFPYAIYWGNAMASAVAMRALMEDFGIPEQQADDAFTAGLVSGIGWLAVAETFPALMSKYLRRCGNADPLAKIRAQKEIFPCPIRQVSERYLERFSFPDIVRATVAGKAAEHRNWGECLARALRVSQNLMPFVCQPVLPMAVVPAACSAEWAHWQGLLTGVGRH